MGDGSGGFRPNGRRAHYCHEIPLSIVAYDTKEEVMEWMLDIQLGRRNLSPIQRIAVAEKYRPIYERQAQKNLEEGGRKGGLVSANKPLVNLPNPSSMIDKIDVREKLASVAGVSGKTYSMGKKILDSDNETLKQEVLSGEKSINAGYKELIESNLRQRVLGNTNPVKLGRCFEFLNNWYGFIQGTNQYSFTKVLCSSEKHNPKNQTELAESYGITQQTMNNYMRMASMILELEDLQDEKSKLRALISNNFGRRQNDPVKDRKALATYVELKGYKHGEMGNGRKKTCQNGTSTLDEIAKELNMSKRNLQRALRIERNLTDSMKELLDTGEIYHCIGSMMDC